MTKATLTPSLAKIAMLAAKLERAQNDIVNAKRDAPIRERFHKYLDSEGFAPQVTPAPGATYAGSTAQMLWECYLAATLAERTSAHKAVGVTS